MEEEIKILTGKIEFKIVNKNSKSECLKPFLICEDKSSICLFMKGDNPFENSTLKTFENKTVEIKGFVKRNVFNIVEISKILSF